MTKTQIEELDKIIGDRSSIRIVRHWGIVTAHCPFCNDKIQKGVMDEDAIPDEKSEQLERFKIYHILFHI